MRGFFVNRDSDTHRRATFEARAAAAGLAFERIAAVTPSADETASAQNGRYRRRPSGWTPLQPGELGCFLSHRRVWEIVVGEGVPWAVVVEDDVHFSSATAALLERLPTCAAEADLVKLETYLDPVEVGRQGIRVSDDFVLKRLHSKHVGSAGYVVSLAGARRLLRHTEVYVGPVDLMMFDPDLGTALHLEVFQLDPACCIQSDRAGPSEGLRPASSIGERPDRSKFSRAGRHVLLRKIRREFGRAIVNLRSAVRRFVGSSERKIVPFRG